MSGHIHPSQNVLTNDLSPLVTAAIAAQQQLQQQGQLPSNQSQTIPSGSTSFSLPNHIEASFTGNPIVQWQHQLHQPQNGTFAFMLPSAIAAYAQPLLNLAPRHNPASQWVPSQYQVASQPVSAPSRANVQETSTNIIASLISTLQDHLAQLQPQTQQQSNRTSSAEPFSLQTHTHAGPIRVGSTPDDEKRLLEALRGCKNGGLNPREALDGLDGVNDHSATAWKDYFLEHLHRLYPSSRQPEPGENLPDTHSRSSTSLREGSLQEPDSLMTPQSLERRAPPVIPRRQNRMTVMAEATQSESVPALPPKTMPASSSADVPLEYLRRSSDFLVALPSDQRRGTPVIMTHAGVRVHLLRTRIKPTAPVWEDPDGSRFTDAEKTFFIRYLHWRMHDSPTVSKNELYDELAQQLPHHDPDAWKQHWDRYPELPDRIYSEGRSRTSQSTRRSNTETAVLDHKDKQVEGCPSQSSDDTEEDASSSDSECSDDQCDSPSVATTSRAPQPITEEDLRAMARYRVENRATWHLHTTQRGRWQGFAKLPKNAAKRTVAGWTRIMTSHPTQLQAYYKEYLAEVERGSTAPAQGTVSKAARDTAPQSKDGNKPDAGGWRGSQLPRKRQAAALKRYVPDGGSSSPIPARKRRKENPSNDTMHQAIELSD